MIEALAFIEIDGWSPAMVVLDAMEKRAGVRVLETELNDSPGVCMKLYGRLGDIESAARAAEETASAMQTPAVVHIIPGPSELSPAAYQAGPDFSPLIEQSTVQIPENDMSDQSSFAVGLIETQGFTAVFEAIDTALKTAAVEVLAREKLVREENERCPIESNPGGSFSELPRA
ncbi:MAG: BMC domain-containing protein [Bryobacteraceae bacterium]